MFCPSPLEITILVSNSSCPTLGTKKDCGGLNLAGCQVPTKSTPSLPLLSWTGETKYNKKLVGQNKGGRSLSNYCHRQNILNLHKINLLPIKSEQDNDKIKTKS